MISGCLHKIHAAEKTIKSFRLRLKFKNLVYPSIVEECFVLTADSWSHFCVLIGFVELLWLWQNRLIRFRCTEIKPFDNIHFVTWVQIMSQKSKPQCGRRLLVIFGTWSRIEDDFLSPFRSEASPEVLRLFFGNTRPNQTC